MGLDVTQTEIKNPTRGMTKKQIRLDALFSQLESIHHGYEDAAREITGFTGQPLCTYEKCASWCCQHASVVGLGIEAHHIVSYLLGQPWLIKPTIDRLREWLTRRDKPYTYASKLTQELFIDRYAEFLAIHGERCAFLGDDGKCTIYWARPLVCRAYGTTHIPDRACPRPLGFGEDSGSRVRWDAHNPRIPLYDMVAALRRDMTEQEFAREGFVATMVFERMAAKELAGLVDDGRIPIMKLVNGMGDGLAGLLWQEQLDTQWSNQLADLAIASQVPLAERDGQMFQRIKVK